MYIFKIFYVFQYISGTDIKGLKLYVAILIALFKYSIKYNRTICWYARKIPFLFEFTLISQTKISYCLRIQQLFNQ